MNNTKNKIDPTLVEREQAILDTALLESDQLLARSLQDDDQRRRRRLGWSALIIGGVVMGTLIVASIMGWLTLGQVGSAGSATPSIEQTEQAESLSAAGWELWKQRKYSDATEKFAAAVKQNPRETNAWNGLGWSQFNSGSSEQAVAAFEKCVALEPQHPAALNGLGQIYLMWKDYVQAEKYLLLAAPQAPAAWYGLAKVYLLQGKYEQAKPWAEKIVAQNPQDEGAKQMLAAAQAAKLDDDLRRKIEPAGKPTAHSADAIRGWKMFQQGKSSTAERLFRRALEADAENLSAMNGLAFCLLNLGKHEQAQPLFEKYLSLKPKAAGPLNGLARCLKASGKIDEAIATWEKMAKLYPGPNAAAVGLANTYLERKEFDKAVKHFQVLVDADATNRQFQDGLKNAQAGLKN